MKTAQQSPKARQPKQRSLSELKSSWPFASDASASKPGQPRADDIAGAAATPADAQPEPKPDEAPTAKPEPTPAQLAENLRELSGASYLLAIMFEILGGHMTPAAITELKNDFLAKCGNPADPIEVLMAEQLLMSHHAVGRLHYRATRENDYEAATAYAAAATRLTAEFRRSALAFQEYRSKSSPRLGIVDADTNEKRDTPVASRGRVA